MVETSIGKSKLKPGEHQCISVNGKKLSLYYAEGKYYCVDNTCTHAGGPLCEGTAEKFTVTCPWHESVFDYRTGKVLSGPATDSVKTYQVHEKNGELFIDI